MTTFNKIIKVSRPSFLPQQLTLPPHRFTAKVAGESVSVKIKAGKQFLENILTNKNFINNIYVMREHALSRQESSTDVRGQLTDKQEADVIMNTVKQGGVTATNTPGVSQDRDDIPSGTEEYSDIISLHNHPLANSPEIESFSPDDLIQLYHPSIASFGLGYTSGEIFYSKYRQYAIDHFSLIIFASDNKSHEPIGSKKFYKIMIRMMQRDMRDNYFNKMNLMYKEIAEKLGISALFVEYDLSSTDRVGVRWDREMYADINKTILSNMKYYYEKNEIDKAAIEKMSDEYEEGSNPRTSAKEMLED